MQSILKRARVLLLEAITISAVIADNKVTLGELVKLKMKGMTQQYGLNDFIPETGSEIKTFEELSADDIHVITRGHYVPDEILKIVYESARLYYLAIKRLVTNIPEATAEIIVSTGKVLDDVKGVGPRILSILNSEGIQEVKELAEFDIDKLNEILKSHGPLFSNKAVELITNAKELLK